MSLRGQRQSKAVALWGPRPFRRPCRRLFCAWSVRWMRDFLAWFSECPHGFGPLHLGVKTSIVAAHADASAMRDASLLNYSSAASIFTFVTRRLGDGELKGRLAQRRDEINHVSKTYQTKLEAVAMRRAQGTLIVFRPEGCPRVVEKPNARAAPAERSSSEILSWHQ